MNNFEKVKNYIASLENSIGCSEILDVSIIGEGVFTVSNEKDCSNIKCTDSINGSNCSNFGVCDNSTNRQSCQNKPLPSGGGHDSGGTSCGNPSSIGFPGLSF